jgi:hypothetical protein
MSSPWVGREVGVAASAKIRILPIIIETVPDDSWPAQLAGTSHVDFRRAEDYRRSFQRLVDSVLGSGGEAVYLTAKEAVSAGEGQVHCDRRVIWHIATRRCDPILTRK